MTQIIEFNDKSFLTLSKGVNPGPNNLLHQGKGSRYEVSSIRDEDGFKKLTLTLAPRNNQTWFVLPAVVNVLNFQKASPTPPLQSSTLYVIEFTKDSYLTQNPHGVNPASLSNNEIFQGVGAKYEVYLTPSPVSNDHQEVRIPIKPDNKETWWFPQRDVSIRVK